MRRLAIDWSVDERHLVRSLAELLEQGFEQVHGCVVLSAIADEARRDAIAPHQDEVGLEAFHNHVHMEDHLPAGFTLVQLHEQVVAYMRGVVRRLREACPATAFVVAVGTDDQEGHESFMRTVWGDDLDPEDLVFSPSAVVRFHTLRLDQSWLSDDLEDYAAAVARVQVGP